MRTRRAVSLVEVLVAIAILAILLSLLLAAIQKVRQAGLATQSKNNLRQIILGVHQLAELKEGTVPKLMTEHMFRVKYVTSDAVLFNRLLPYVNGPFPEWRPDMSNEEMNNAFLPAAKCYRNPADSSLTQHPFYASDNGNYRTKISYAANMSAMSGSVNLVAGVGDGTSNTIAFTDKYFLCGNRDDGTGETVHLYDYTNDGIGMTPSGPQILLGGNRRATFADAGWHDVVPVTDAATHTTRPSVPGKTFEAGVRFGLADMHIPQTPFHGGLTVALFDGSVRTVSPGVHETAFWAAVTPAGGEVAGLGD